MARDIGEWLDGLGLGRYAEAFADNEIDLPALPHITEQDLKEIGVALGARRKLRAAIAELVDGGEPASADARSGERSASAEAERRQLTVMFVDLVGSTALSGRLDPAVPGPAPVELAQRLNDAEACVNRPAGVVLVRLGIAQLDQEPVADILRDMTLEAADGGRAGVLEGADHLAQVFGVEPP